MFSVASKTSNGRRTLFRALSSVLTVGSPPAGDPYWSNVVLLMPMETDFADAKSHTATLVGSPTLSSSNNPAPYGSYCGQFGSAKTVTFSDSADWALGQTFTIEFWIKPTSTDLSGIHNIYDQRSAALVGFQIGIYNGKFLHWISNFSVFDYTTPGNPTLVAGTPYHVALVYDAVSTEKVRFYVGGTKVLTASTQRSVTDIAAVLSIGGDVAGFGQHFYGTLKTAH